MPDQPLVADRRHLDGVAVLHHRQGRQDGAQGEVGVVDRPPGLIEDLPGCQRDRLQQGEQAVICRLPGAGPGIGSAAWSVRVACVDMRALANLSSGKDHRWQGPDPFGSPDVKRAMNSQD